MFDFAALPPEVNSGRMYLGAGSGPLLAAAAAWDDLAAELQSAAASYGSTVQGLTSGQWTGPSSIAAAAAATPYVSWMSATGARAERAATAAKIAAGAYEAAFAATVPPPVITANRAMLAQLIATNILGQNTPAIAATEAHYGKRRGPRTPPQCTAMRRPRRARHSCRRSDEPPKTTKTTPRGRAGERRPNPTPWRELTAPRSCPQLSTTL